MSTHLPQLKAQLAPEKPTPDARSAQRPSKLVLLFVSLALSGALFLTLDWIRTRTILRKLNLTPQADACQVRDPVRHHAYQPNCEAIGYWGADAYKIFTNNLGFRDEKIRDIPPTDVRPRILLLGDSFTEGKIAWRSSFVGKIAEHFPQYDFLNGGLSGYSPSNYLNTTRMVLARGIDLDEVIVFLDNSAVQLEASFYRDIDASGAVVGLERAQQHSATSWYIKFRRVVTRHFALTAQIFRFFDRVQNFLSAMVFITSGDYFGDPFDMEMSAWTYRKVNETDLFPAGYAPLGVEGGIAKEKAKMTLLWQELKERNIPLSIVIYPHLGQIAHDTADSAQVQIWREWCEGKCKRFINVLPAFFAVKDQCPRSEPGCWYPKLFVIRDIHYTAAGNSLVADEVIKSLQQNPPTKHPAAPLVPPARTSNLSREGPISPDLNALKMNTPASSPRRGCNFGEKKGSDVLQSL